MDDEATLRKTSKLILGSLGYTVTVCSSGPEALELFVRQPDRFDLLITDMTMPKMSGEELCVRVLELRPEIPTIICTGFSAQLTEEVAKNRGIRAVLTKPVLKQQMAEAIRGVLDQRDHGHGFPDES